MQWVEHFRNYIKIGFIFGINCPYIWRDSICLAVLCPILSFSLWKEVTLLSTSICKPYIFYRPGLLNTEIIITAILKPLIFSPKSVGIYGGRFQRLRKHNRHKPIPLLSDQAVPPTATSNAAAVSTTNQITRRWSRRTWSLQWELIKVQTRYTAIRSFSAYTLNMRLVCIGAM